MSNNIDHCEYISGSLSISKKNVKKLLSTFWSEYLPEGGFIAELLFDPSVNEEIKPDDLPEICDLKFPCFYGEHSQYTVIQEFWQRSLPFCEGDADILLIYESVNLEGWRKEGNSVREHEVLIKLGEAYQ